MPTTVPTYYIYCYWLWLASLLYIADIYKYPPIVSLGLATLFTMVYSYSYAPADRMIFITLWELAFLYITYTTWLRRGGRWACYNLICEVSLFLVYLLFLQWSGESFYSIYFVKNKAVQQRFKGTVFDYIYMRLTGYR